MGDPTICKCGSESLTLKTIGTEWSSVVLPLACAVDSVTNWGIRMSDPMPATLRRTLID